MECMNCGHKLRDGAKFCPFCGAPAKTSIIDEDVINPSYPLSDQQRQESDHIYPSGKRKKKLPVVLASVLGVLVAAAVIVTVLLVHKADQTPDYKKIFRIYKDELQAVETDIENYADRRDMDVEDRNLIAVSTVLDQKVPSMFYVVDGQDNRNHVPVIKMCEVQGDAAHNVFESTVDDDSANYICILKNSRTGDLYLFADAESSENGNVVIYGLNKANGRIKQEEMYRLAYKVNSDEDKTHPDYQYFIDQNSVSEEEYNNAIKEFVPTIDTVIVASDTKTDGLKYNYFKNLASVAMSYDDTIEYLDNGINNATFDEVQPKKVQPTETVFMELESVDDLPGDFEKELGLLCYYDSKSKEIRDEHYYEERRNFDCNDPDTYEHYMIESLMPFLTPVRLFIYPGENTPQVEKGPDPLNKYNGDPFCRVSYDKIVWVAKNIFHVPQDQIDNMVAYACDNTDIYLYEDSDKKYLVTRGSGADSIKVEKQYKKILTDGEKYYLLIEYDYDKTKGLPTETYYLEASYENIDGQNYWTVYRHTLSIPESMKKRMTDADSDHQEATDVSDNTTEVASQSLSVDDYIELYSQESFYHKRFKKDTDYSLPLLKVSSDDAAVFNQKMKSIYDEILKKLSSGEPVDFMDLPLRVSYEAYLNDGILSLCIKRDNGLNNYIFYVINIDIHSGGRLNNDEILSRLGVTFDGIRDDIRSSLKKAYMSEYGSAYEQMDSETKAYCDKSFSDEKIEEVSLYFSSDKSLYGAFHINYMYQSGWNECNARIEY